jgi:thioredoxin 1
MNRRLMLTLASAAGVASGLGLVLYLRTTPPESSLDAAPTADPVAQALRQGRPAMIQFGANACAACREMKPVVEALQREHGTRFTVMNVDLIAQKHRGYLQRFRIQLMPTQVFFDAAGNETYRNMGTMTGAAMLTRLEGQPT